MNNLKLRVCLTDKCNMRCEYCRSGGEGGGNASSQLTNGELMDIIAKMSLLGVESVRLTGGEPLLRDGFFDLIKGISKIETLKKYTLVTNGALLTDAVVSELSQYNFKSVTVSLDTVDTKLFAKITNTSYCQKVLNAILKLQKSELKTKINTVVTRTNIEKIQELIEFANENCIDIKLLDLFSEDSTFLQEKYCSLSGIETYLKEMASGVSVQYQDEGFGTPEIVYRLKNINVVVKDSFRGTCYIDKCKQCFLYPCQTGIVSLVLTSDGILKLCTLSNEHNFDAKVLLQGDTSMTKDIERMISEFNSAKFEKLWGMQ